MSAETPGSSGAKSTRGRYPKGGPQRAVLDHTASVMVVDDEESMLHLIGTGLKRLGHSVTTFGDPLEAVRAFEQERYDVVVSDIMMPQMDGFELLRRVRAVDRDVPVILVTAYSTLEYAITALQEGAYGFITKPFRVDELAQNVGRAVERRFLLQENETYRKQLEQKVEERTAQLQEAHEKLEREHLKRGSYISSAHFGFVATTPEGEIRTLNPQAVKLLRLGDANAAMGRPLLEVASEHLREDIAELFSQVRSGSVERGDNIHRVNRAEPRRVLDLTTYPVHEGEQLSDIVLIAQDITDKTLMEQQLRQSAKLASLGELAAGVAHEINNPVGFIGSNLSTFSRYGEALQQWVATSREALRVLAEAMPEVAGAHAAHVEDLYGRLDIEFVLEDLAGLITESRQGVESIKNIVLGLKSFARPDDERPQLTDLNADVLERAAALSRNEVKYKATLETELGELPDLMCFPNALCQVFINLLVNAAQALEDGGTIRLSSHAETDFAVVTVQDTGVGIPEEILESIFDPFFTTKEVGVGTGLGLSISYGIVQRHGGSIDVDSRPGEGTTFTVRLPFRVPERRSENDED